MFPRFFNAKKSAQAAVFVLRLNGGQMDKYLFIKILYLADRQAYERWSQSITGDDAISMEFGPVLSAIYDLTKGARPELRLDWEPFISDADEQTNLIFAKENPGIDELSPSELKLLQATYEHFKNFTFQQMKEYCHNLSEYDESVGKGAKLIRPEEILQAIGKTNEEIQEADQMSNEVALLRLMFGAC